MTLVEFQDKLQTRFAFLRSSRAKGSPLFAFEHGLDSNELDQIAVQLLEDTLPRGANFGHWLVWVVYSTEIGYRYAGDEFWQTFESDTPGWNSPDDRYKLRRCFLKFHQDFGGYKPIGKWAEHFNIISWPIANAILPKDLQQQFARILYDIRYQLELKHFSSPSLLGELIAAFSSDATSRFRILAENTTLTGLIATELLSQHASESDRVISSSALKRISADLNKERKTKTWLRSATDSARRRRLKGFIDAAETGATGDLPDNGTYGAPSSLGIEPDILLQPSTDSSWNVILEIPSLALLSQIDPSFRQVVAESRCNIPSTKRTPFAPGRFLSGPKKELLKEWPKTGVSLIEFLNAPLSFQSYLATAFRLEPRSRWLFKINSSGIGHHVRVQRVLAGQTYILVAPRLSETDNSFASQIKLNCENINGIELKIPDIVPTELSTFLASLGLSHRSTIELQPVGLSPVKWDGSGHMEWLTNELPILNIRCDHPSKLVSADIDDRRNLSYFGQSDFKHDHFIELPALEQGNHKLSISLISKHNNEKSVGHCELLVRNPGKSSDVLKNQLPVMILQDPPFATLEDFWEGKCSVEIHGPENHSVTGRLQFYSRDSITPCLDLSLPKVALPLAASDWDSFFDTHIRSKNAVQAKFDEAQTAEISFISKLYGRHHVRLEREFTPIRWIVKRRQRSYGIRLIDDSNSTDRLDIFRCDYSTPDLKQPYTSKDFVSLEPACDTGGLYAAVINGYQRAVLVPPSQGHISRFGVEPVFSEHPKNTHTLSKLLNIIDVWAKARQPGDILAETLRLKVLRYATGHIAGLICGQKWRDLEFSYLNEANHNVLEQMEQSIGKRQHEKKIGQLLSHNLENLVKLPIKNRISRFAELLNRHNSLDKLEFEDKWSVASLVLRFGSQPNNVEEWFGDDPSQWYDYILERPILLRAARYFVLSVSNICNDRVITTSELHEGWNWDE